MLEETQDTTTGDGGEESFIRNLQRAITREPRSKMFNHFTHYSGALGKYVVTANACEQGSMVFFLTHYNTVLMVSERENRGLSGKLGCHQVLRTDAKHRRRGEQEEVIQW